MKVASCTKRLWLLLVIASCKKDDPIVATRLLTHTQVLSEEVAILTGPTPEEFARGILLAVNDPAFATRIGSAARRLAETRYTYEAYLQRTREACAALVA